MAVGTSAGAGVSRGRTLIYLARHGQTPLNESGVLQGLADPPLDDAGHDQARRLGEALGLCSASTNCLVRSGHNLGIGVVAERPAQSAVFP
jgi:hypothetical protein